MNTNKIFDPEEPRKRTQDPLEKPKAFHVIIRNFVIIKHRGYTHLVYWTENVSASCRIEGKSVSPIDQ